jgi:cell division protein FtsN
MRDYEEKSYYEIQLDNKQLILVFLAGVTVCVLVFILGVMVGKGRKEAEFASISKTEQKVVRPEPDLTPPQEIQEMKPSAKKQEAKKEDLKQAKSESTQEDPAYYELDTDKEKPLEKEPIKEKKDETTIASKDTDKKTTDKKAETAKAEKPKTETPKDEIAKAEPQPKAESTEEDIVPEPTLKDGGKYTVQVMATSSKSKAEQQLSTLQANGYTAFMKEEKAGDASVFKVRVGRFSDKDAAKKIATKLKQELRLESWVANLD